MPNPPKKILVLGGTGMLGHQLAREMNERFEVAVTTRGSASAWDDHPVLGPFERLGEVRVECLDSVLDALGRVEPDVVINAVGLIKQDPRGDDPLAAIEINAAFPHRLACLCRLSGTHLVHIGTDCVFSGRRGGYTEDDLPDPPDLYGRTKLLGEVGGPGCLTLRTSLVGRELRNSREPRGLVEWFLSQECGAVRGYTQAVFSGFVTRTFARCLAELLTERPDLEGVWHMAAEPIAKYDLLLRLRDAFGLDVEIEPDDRVVIDRSLDASKLRTETGFEPPSWDDMIQDLHDDPIPYETLRSDDAGG